MKRHTSTKSFRLQDFKKFWIGAGFCSKPRCKSPAKEYTDYCNGHSKCISDRGKHAIDKMIKESDYIRSKRIGRSLNKLKIKSGFKLSVGELKDNLSPYIKSRTEYSVND